MNYMNCMNDLSTATIRDLLFEQTKRMTFETLRSQRKMLEV